MPDNCGSKARGVRGAWLLLFIGTTAAVFGWYHTVAAAAKPEGRTSFQTKKELSNRHLKANATGLMIAYQIPIFLVLQYINVTIAQQLEEDSRTADPLASTKQPLEHGTSQYLCQSVNLQASGSQVALAAHAIGAVFETHIMNDTGNSQPDYECTIRQISRKYDPDGVGMFGRGYMTLEVWVEQMVYVKNQSTTENVTLSLDQAVDVVSMGFNRGAGGRIKFRALLQENPDFGSVVNVEALENSLSPQQAFPSSSPTQLPTSNAFLVPSDVPSLDKATAPQSMLVMPSRLVSSARPAKIRTRVPMQFAAASGQPFIDGSISPSGPSAQPMDMSETTLTPATPSEARGQGNDSDPAEQGLILGAIAGGVATIMVSCFFVFCVWFPFCKRHDYTEEEDGDNSNNNASDLRTIHDSYARRPSQSYAGGGYTYPGNRSRTSSQSSHGRTAAAMIPGIVQLDDQQSLANTSIGDHTAGGGPYAGGVQPTPPSIPTMRLLESDPMRDSFDESSLYTSPFVDVDDFAVHTTANSASTFRILDTTTRLRQNSRALRTFDQDDDDSDEDDSMMDEVTIGSSMFRTLPSVLNAKSVESEAFERQHHKQNVLAGNDTKGFDPFADTNSESTFGFESDFFDSTVRKIHEAVSSSSSATSEDDNQEVILLGDGGSMLAPKPSIGVDENPPDGEEEKVEIEQHEPEEGLSVKNDVEALSSLPEHPRSRARSRKELRNNTLLRMVLEDARKISLSKSPTNRSRASRKSAPSRLPMHLSKKHTGRSIITPMDLLADNLELHEAALRNIKAMRSSSRSVGGAAALHATEDGLANLGGMATPTNHARHHPPPRPTPPTLKRAAPKSPNDNKTAVGEENSSIQEYIHEASRPTTPTSADQWSSVVVGVGSDSVEADVQVEGVLSATNNGEKVETPMSTSGRLGIGAMRNAEDGPEEASTESEGRSNSWLFKAMEETLGPRSAAADIESISGRSGRSGKSSKRSRNSTRSRRVGKSGRSSRTSASSDGVDEEKTSAASKAHRHGRAKSDLGLDSRSLENELRRLEKQLEEALQTEVDQITTSSITVSTGAGKRPVASRKSISRAKNKGRVDIIVPPGKLGVVLTNKNDGKGVVVSEIRDYSSMKGTIFPGDKIVAIDGENVSAMVVNDIISLMASKNDKERRMTFISRHMHFNHQESKSEASSAANLISGVR